MITGHQLSSNTTALGERDISWKYIGKFQIPQSLQKAGTLWKFS